MAAPPPTLKEEQEQLRDLGFGSVISRESHLRLLNRDGSFNVARRGISFWRRLSPYQALLTMSWTRFFLVTVLAYLGANALFAELYVLCGPGSLVDTTSGDTGSAFAQAFFFSVETFATIGFGNIVPMGLLPNLVMTAESLAGLLGFALATGLLFARFSRPTTKFLYSKTSVIAPYHDISAWMFRVTNERSNQIIELQARVVMARFEPAAAGRARRFYPLALERERVAFFPLHWTVVHPIDPTSPLYGVTRQQLHDDHYEFLVLLTGIDETFATTVHSRSSYTDEEISWGAKFAQIFEKESAGERMAIDLERFHGIEPAELNQGES
ncbi:MAG TPA: ion channel [Candidatus Angelobacter sp.]|nr:ion channel [Candidatus Angelobacter sp.]